VCQVVVQHARHHGDKAAEALCGADGAEIPACRLVQAVLAQVAVQQITEETRRKP
jgi:hypothetical protein